MSSPGDLSSPPPDPGPARQLHFPEMEEGGGRAGGRRCSAIKADGEPCRAWAIRGSDPPLCAAHAGRTGAPPRNRLAEKHGFYSRRGAGSTGPGGADPGSRPDLTHIEAVVADLAERQAQLTEYLAALMDRGADVEEVARLFALHGQNASRLGRLLRDQRALSGESADDLLDAIGKALDEIGEELGIEL
jgi:hypothetical protein